MKRFNPFYCYKKNCRKTAWDTPEYLTVDDWELVYKLIEALEAGDKQRFDGQLYFRPSTKNTPLPADWEDRDYAFFNRIIGWPEGKSYYFRQTYETTNTCYFDGFIKNDLSNLKKAVEENKELIKKKWKKFLAAR